MSEIKYKKDPACLFDEHGWVEIDHEQLLVRRCIPTSYAIGPFLQSETYRIVTENGWMPRATLLSNDDHDEDDEDDAARNWTWISVDYIDFITRPNEWTATQRISAITMLISLQRALIEGGYVLRYPHLCNVTLAPQPIMIDFGDLRPYLHLTRSERSKYALSFFDFIERCFTDRDVGDACKPQTLVGEERWSTLHQSLRDAVQQLCRLFANAEYRQLDDKFAELERVMESTWKSVRDKCGAWSAYERIDIPKQFTEKSAQTQQQKSDTVWRTLNQLRPRTLVDIGCNSGFYSFMAQCSGATTIGLDCCEDVVGAAYTRNIERQDSVRFAVVDLLALPPPMGVHGAYRSISERICGEGAIVPAVTHHLSRKIDFETQSRILSGFASRWILVEFVSRNDKHVRTWSMGAWYTKENFVAAFAKHWSHYVCMPSYPKPREFYLFFNNDTSDDSMLARAEMLGNVHVLD